MTTREPGTESVRNFDPDLLRQIRRDRGLTHDALAELVRIDRPTLISYERKRRRPTPRRLVDLARALGIDPIDLTTSSLKTATLADLRTRAGLDVTAIAAQLGVKRSEYYAIERDGLPLGPDIAKALPGLLGVSARQISDAVKRSRLAQKEQP